MFWSETGYTILIVNGNSGCKAVALYSPLLKALLAGGFVHIVGGLMELMVV